MITLDGYAASHRAVAKLKTSGILPRRDELVERVKEEATATELA